MTGPKRMSDRRPLAQHRRRSRLASAILSPTMFMVWAALAIGLGLAIGSRL